MSIYIYNSLTRKKEEFIPLNPPDVNIYTCGVTVYDECHIGHARSLYCFDLIRRYLARRGFRVNFVRNITDIDDKIINRANELKVDWKELVEKYIESYKTDMRSLGVGFGVFDGKEEPRATRNIPEIIKYIEALIEKGCAYPAPSGVYFSVRNFKNYGRLSGQSIDAMMNGARIEPDEKKKDPLDFALWKRSKPDEPFWDSPWGAGRPGWHIECSVMSTKYNKTDTLDIHAGGRDLIFPHHENEIAQSEAKTGKPFAKYWIHHGLLTINNQKMSKSLGNFITIKDFLAKYKDPDILKLFFLSTHYSSPIDFTEEKMREADKARGHFAQFLDRIRNIEPDAKAGNPEKVKEIDEIRAEFESAMDDDFNTPEALAALFNLVNTADGYFTRYSKNIKRLEYAKEVLSDIADLLGLSLKGRQFKAGVEEGIKENIELRNSLRKKKDFKGADKIRKELEKQGIILEDTKDGTIWRRA